MNTIEETTKFENAKTNEFTAQSIPSPIPNFKNNVLLEKGDAGEYHGDNLMMSVEEKDSSSTESAPELKIRYHREKFPALPDVVKYGNFIDLYNAEERILKAGEFTYLNLGISVEIPKGFWMQVCPRSSTFKNYNIIQTNSFGVVDTKYCGDDDIVKLPVYALKDTIIPANERICQFRLVKDIEFAIIPVEKLDGENRGGFGSSGRN